MILCDREIRAAMARGSLTITPEPSPNSFSSTAVDLTLDTQIRLWKSPGGSGVESRICPGSPEFNYTAIADQHTQVIDIPETGYDLKPDTFLLGWTAERVQLPHQSRIAARVEGKSSLARLGIGVHVTAPTIHAGFGYNPQHPTHGLPIQLEIFNVSKLTIQLKRGMAICQLILEEVHGTPDKGYAGMFSQQGPR